MADANIKVSVDNTEIDETLKKLRKLHKHLKKAKKIAKELSSLNIDISLSESIKTPLSTMGVCGVWGATPNSDNGV